MPLWKIQVSFQQYGEMTPVLYRDMFSNITRYEAKGGETFGLRLRRAEELVGPGRNLTMKEHSLNTDFADFQTGQEGGRK